MTPPPRTHDDCLAALTGDTLARLHAIQAEVESRVPDAQRCVAYGLPAYRRVRPFFYFGAYRHHIGVYPPVTDPPGLVAETAPFRGPKGNLAFPHAQPLPIDLIGRVAEALARQYTR